MSNSFANRVEFIRELLNSTQQEIVLDGYDLLFELWLEYSSDNKFVEEIKIIATEHVNLTREFKKRVDKLLVSHEKKVALLKPIKSLLPTVSMKIFISYSHKDEPFKDELVTLLTGLQRRGIIGAWQDQRIEPGSEWFDLIIKAMEECEMAILLVSPDFIASRFIQEKGLAHLFRRRIEEGLQVVPIVVRSCLWQDEPVIGSLQILPKNGKPVISFSKENGDRDQVWTDIGIAIESIVKGL
jgi:hypothetical protein